MEVHLKDVVFILNPKGGLLIAGIVLSLLRMFAWPKVKPLLLPDVKGMQTRLFGMHSADFVPLNGVNRWCSADRPTRFFGEDVLKGYPVPPYNYAGLSQVLQSLGDPSSFSVLDEKRIVKLSGNLLVLGGTRINRNVARAMRRFPNLPFRFVTRAHVDERFISARPPATIRRVYTDKEGRRYFRDSKTNGVLVAGSEPDRPPFGPVVSSRGRIESDVILLSIVPGMSGKRTTLVSAGYGANARLWDVLCRGGTLEELCSRGLKDQAHPWMQAVFIVPVEHAKEGEKYGTPELREVRALGRL